MVLHTELPVYRDTYKLVLEIFVSTKNFPKEYKYSLVRDKERDVLVCKFSDKSGLDKGYLYRNV
ncbi:hypothetical protein [Kordia sp.]|uniref:hypothetical protein n=1 Tax=Kordia sp. TaxID=1965332 RepID=UPI0025C47FED|nr:hypothetical protein [Kordia sp.]MCH2194689.1 hypothetical protein [Kordia sp.]